MEVNQITKKLFHKINEILFSVSKTFAFQYSLYTNLKSQYFSNSFYLESYFNIPFKWLLQSQNRGNYKNILLYEKPFLHPIKLSRVWISTINENQLLVFNSKMNPSPRSHYIWKIWDMLLKVKLTHKKRVYEIFLIFVGIFFFCYDFLCNFLIFWMIFFFFVI